MDATPSPRSGGSADQERDELRRLFMERLKRLAELDARCTEDSDSEDRKLLQRALSSTYWDCIRLGLRADARKVLGLSDH